jgi:hypothetical protein
MPLLYNKKHHCNHDGIGFYDNVGLLCFKTIFNGTNSLLFSHEEESMGAITFQISLVQFCRYALNLRNSNTIIYKVSYHPD